MAFANFGAGTHRDLVLDKTADVLCILCVHIVGADSTSGALRWYNFSDSVAGESTGTFDFTTGTSTADHYNLVCFGYFADVAAGTKWFFPQYDGLVGTIQEVTYYAFALY